MTPEEKKLEKLNALFELVNQDFATPDDLIKLSEAILNIITTEKERQTKELENAKGETAQELNAVIATLNAKEQGLKQIITRLTYETEQAVAAVDSKLTKTLSREINRLERKIPTKTDLSGIEAEIKAIQEGLNTLPTELTMNNEAIRDGLELLQGEERLDRSAIKGLDDYEEIARLARTPQTIGNAGVKLLRYLQDVNIEGITNGQTILWNATLQRFEPGSGGTGGGHVIEDEGTPLTQRTNLNFVGAGVTVTDDAGNDTTVVTISGGGSTTPGGSDTQIQFNDGGAFGGDAGLTYNKTTDTVTAVNVGLDLLTLNGGANQDYDIKANGNNGLHIDAKQSGAVAEVDVSSADKDGTDNVAFKAFGVGDSGAANNERIAVGYNAAATDYRIHTVAQGTGTVRVLRIYTGANTSQLVLNTDGTTSSDNDFEITDTSKGIILKSANGTRWRLGITNNGELTAVSL